MTQPSHDLGCIVLKPEERVSTLGHRLLFVVLMLSAFALYVPTTLLPILMEHCRLLTEERRLTDVVAQLEAELQHREEMAKAFAQDSIINERLAVLDLHYANPGEEVVPVLPPDFSVLRLPVAEGPPSRSRLGLPDDWPAWALSVERWANDNGLMGIFLDPGVRPILYFMAGGLVVAAFVVLSPRRRRRRLPTGMSPHVNRHAADSAPNPASSR